MWFELHTAAANGDPESQEALRSILRRVEVDVHSLRFAELADVESTEWFRGLPPYLRQLVRLLMEAQLWSPVQPTLRALRDPTSLHAAERLANTPLSILVENDASDGALIRAAVLAFADPQTLRVWEAGVLATPRGWTLVHCGGTGEMPRLIAETAKAAARPPRLLVVHDSDATVPPTPGQVTSDEHQKTADVARDLAVPLVVLPLREAENYLPDAFWDAWLAADLNLTRYAPTVDALKALSPQQRDHIDMEGDKRLRSPNPGPLFDGTEPNNPPLSEQSRAALTGDRKNLKRGSKGVDGDRSYRIRQLHPLVTSGDVTAANLDERDRDGALRALVRRISELL